MTTDRVLFKADRAMVTMIVGNHLAQHMEVEEAYGHYNPFPISREGLEAALITYCAMIRHGEVPES